MDLNIDCYKILGLNGESTDKEIKKKYYKLSFTHHPDKGGDPEEFNLIHKAYKILSEEREEYDRKSKFGAHYNELEEFFLVDTGDYDHESTQSKFDKVKNREALDVRVKVEEDDFDGSIEYARLVKCKTCDGTGKDLSSKIVIRDEKGNIKQIFDADDGCDFCEGTGKINGHNCSFCGGAGKVGMKECSSCKGDRRILGKQKLTGIELEGEETRVKAMGNHSYYDAGKCGDLIIMV